ncbi:hypothetical protein OC835_001191 [Tilletia horrida]|nr:hypothetical protein OC835_001191 [Tilletia horrida]
MSSPIDVMQQAQVLRNVDKRTRLAVKYNMQRKLHFFRPNAPPLVRGHVTSWMPTMDTCLIDDIAYWQQHLGAKAPSLNQLRFQESVIDETNALQPSSIRIDLRACDYTTSYAASANDDTLAERWKASTMLLHRIARPNPALKYLHLRMSFSAETVLELERILRQATTLSDVVIEADSPAPWNCHDRPTLDLSSTSLVDNDYVDLDRFLLRAPGLKIKASDTVKFFDRLKTCKVVCFAVHSIDAGKNSPVSLWAQHLLSRLPRLQRAEVSVGEEDPDITALQNDFSSCRLPHLVHLVLDMFDVNANLLDQIKAPLLKFLRIRSNCGIGHRGRCQSGRFPRLLSATIDCPGPVLGRFYALGLAEHQFRSGIASHIRLGSDYDGEVHAYIKKFLPNWWDSGFPPAKKPRLAI